MSKRWASDVIVDLLHAYDLPYAALNPGASYRGLHDSIVNYGANRPALMLCQHEETAVQIAHRSEEHTSELQSRLHLVCRLLLEKKNKTPHIYTQTEEDCMDIHTQN